MKNTIGPAALAISFLFAASDAGAAAGSFMLVTGGVQVVDAQGVTRQVVTGGLVDSGDTVLTQGGRAQIRFTDNGQVSLQPRTEFKLADYRFREGGESVESAIFNLIKGGIRVVTGFVGRANKSDYKMTTPTATIGIRGTEFQATMCVASCNQPDGLYVQTGEGIINVSNAAGQIDLGVGESAFVPSADTSPVRTSSAPPLTAPTAVTTALVSLGAGEFQPGTISITNNLGPVTPIVTTTGVVQAGLALVASGVFTPDAAKYPGSSFSGVSSTASASGKLFDAGVVVGAYLANNQFSGLIASAEGNFASIQFDSVLNAGSNGDLYWGRWSNGNFSVFAGLNGTTARESVAVPSSFSLHYLLGLSVPTIPTTGMATFSFVGGTPSTNGSGSLGTGMTSGNMSANFATNVVNANFVVVHGSTLNVNAAMPLTFGNRATFSTNNPGGMITGASGSASGFFVGKGSPTGAGLSYSLNGNIVGVAGFR